MSRPTSSPIPKGTAIIHTMDAPYTLWLTIIMVNDHCQWGTTDCLSSTISTLNGFVCLDRKPPLARKPLPLSISETCHLAVGGCGALGQSRLAFCPLPGRDSTGILRVAQGGATPSGVPVGPRSVHWRGCRVENGTLRNDAIAHICCARRSVYWSRSPPCHCGRFTSRASIQCAAH
jgi:hypothetical protein